MKFDRIEHNRWFLQHNGTLYPWKFRTTSTGCHQAVAANSNFHLATFNIQLFGSILYALYIQWTLVEHSINNGIESREYHIFGLHVVRTLIAITFTCWGYEYFVAQENGNRLLYNFVQSSPGKIQIVKHPVCMNNCTNFSFKLPVTLDLPRRTMYPIKGSFMQEQLFALNPAMLYTLCPIVSVLFLLESDDKQFAFSLLPTEIQQSWVMKVVAAALESRFNHVLAAMAQFGAFHCVAFVRTIQTTLAHFTKELK